MEIFRFKKFSVSNFRSAMKVNTDGVLLGSAMTLKPSDRLVLDIGTGTGVIALMIAQRLSEMDSLPRIEAIDIDEASADEARENFEASPWAGCLSSRNVSLADYVVKEKIDLVVSNPPYFESSLKAPDGRRRGARHAETMSYREILDFASFSLSPEGRLSLILPAETGLDLVRQAAARGLHLFRILRVRSTPARPVSRIIAEFSRKNAGTIQEEELIIQEGGGYTPAYRNLMRDFLLI